MDTHTEGLIQAALERLMRGRTSFVIAHRLSTIQHANRIVVLHHGRVRETGTHAELLALGGIYTRLYQLQHLGGRSLGERRAPSGRVEREVSATEPASNAAVLDSRLNLA